MDLSSYLAQEPLLTELGNAVSRRTLDCKEVLFSQGEKVKAFYIVESGRIRTERYTVDGSVTTIQVARDADSLASETLFCDRYDCSAICEVKTTVTIFQKDVLMCFLQENIDLLMLFSQCLSKHISSLKNNLEIRGIRSAKNRILRYLQIGSEGEDNIIRIDRPLKDIAYEVGLAPEVLYRTLGLLEKEGRIVRRKHSIQLIELAGMI